MSTMTECIESTMIGVSAGATLLAGVRPWGMSPRAGPAAAFRGPHIDQPHASPEQPTLADLTLRKVRRLMTCRRIACRRQRLVEERSLRTDCHMAEIGPSQRVSGPWHVWPAPLIASVSPLLDGPPAGVMQHLPTVVSPLERDIHG